jgi:hypothetical protein
VVFSIYSTNVTTGNIPYTITGVTSNVINNASLTGNFVVSGGSGNVTITTSSGLVSVYTMSMTADGSTANVNISPNVSITTAIVGVGYTGNTSFAEGPIPGQMNIYESLVTVAQYDKGGSSVSAYDITGQMNIYNSPVTVTDATKGTPTALLLTNNMANSTILPYSTITTSIAGPIQQGVIKLFGDIPQREYWL